MESITAQRATEETPTRAATLALICTGYFMVILDATGALVSARQSRG